MKERGSYYSKVNGVKLFNPAIEENVFNFLGIIIILNDTIEVHVKPLQNVYKTLKNASLTINAEKIFFPTKFTVPRFFGRYKWFNN